MIVLDEPIDRLAMLVEYLRPVVSEFSIVDTGSAKFEQHAETIRSWPGVTLNQFEWVDDFSAARNHALSFLTTDLVLHVDADELPSFTMMQHMLWLQNNMPPKAMGYQFWTKNWWGGIIGGEAPYHWHCRLFRRGHGRWYKKVHEQVALDGHKEGSASSRGILVQAAKEAYLIHSKPEETMMRANEVYTKIGEGPRP